MLSLIIPFGGPLDRTDVLEDLLEVVARFEVASLHLVATLEVNVVLPAVPVITKEYHEGFMGW